MEKESCWKELNDWEQSSKSEGELAPRAMPPYLIYTFSEQYWKTSLGVWGSQKHWFEPNIQSGKLVMHFKTVQCMFTYSHTGKLVHISSTSTVRSTSCVENSISAGVNTISSLHFFSCILVNKPLSTNWDVSASRPQCPCNCV